MTSQLLTPVEEKTFVVYDSATGEIRHVHTVVTFGGARSRSVKAQDAAARQYAVQFGGAVGRKLQVLRTATFPTHISQRVDLKTRRLLITDGRIGETERRAARKK